MPTPGKASSPDTDPAALDLRMPSLQDCEEYSRLFKPPSPQELVTVAGPDERTCVGHPGDRQPLNVETLDGRW